MSDSSHFSGYPANFSYPGCEGSQNTPLTDLSSVNGYFENDVYFSDADYSLLAFNALNQGNLDPQGLNGGSTQTEPSAYVGDWAPEFTTHQQQRNGTGRLHTINDPEVFLQDASAPPWVPSQSSQSLAKESLQWPSGSMAKGKQRVPIATTDQLRWRSQHSGPWNRPPASGGQFPVLDTLSQPGYATVSSTSAGDATGTAQASIPPTAQPCNAGALGECPEKGDKRLISRHVSNSTKSSSSSSSFTCLECGEIVARSGDLERHRVNAHGISEPFFSCDRCHWDDRRLDKVQGHCQDKHGDEKGFERYGIQHGAPSRTKRSRGPNKAPRKKRA